MLDALNKLYNDPTYLIVAFLCFVLFICIIKKPARQEEEPPTEASCAPELPASPHVAFIGAIPILPPSNPPLLAAPAPPVIKASTAPAIEQLERLVIYGVAEFKQASILVPGGYVDQLISTFVDCYNISLSKPDDEGRVRMRFLPPGAFPDGFLVA